jgi:hypothetical protein
MGWVEPIATFVLGAVSVMAFQGRTRCSAHSDLVADIREIRENVAKLLERTEGG